MNDIVFWLFKSVKSLNTENSENGRIVEEKEWMGINNWEWRKEKETTEKELIWKNEQDWTNIKERLGRTNEKKRLKKTSKNRTKKKQKERTF